MKLKKVIALAAAGALALSLAGCHISTPDVAVTVNGTDIPAGLYLAYQMQAATSADNQLKAQDKSLKDRDATLERDGQQLSAQDWVKAETRAGVARSVWATQQFDEQGLSFTEEELASIDSMVAMAYSYSGDLFSENGIGEASFKAYYTAEMKYQKLLDQYVEENRKDVPDADVKAYVDEHYNRVRALTLPTTNADYEKVGDEDLAVIQGYADELLAELEKGAALDDDLAEKYLKKAFETTGREWADTSLSTYFTTNFQNKETTSEEGTLSYAAATGKVGDKGKVLSSDTPTVYEIIKNYTDDDDFAENRDSLAGSLLDSRFEEDASAAWQALADGADFTAAEKNFPQSKVKLA